MRSKADETFVIVETLICTLQISHDAFCLHIFNHALLLIVIEEVQNYGKIVFTKNIVENG